MSNPLNPLTVLRQAVVEVPPLKYALGVAGLVAVVAIVRLFGVNPVNAVFGSVVLLFLMVALLIFAKLTTLRAGPFMLPAVILMWSALVLLIACAFLLFTSTFFGWPLDFKVTTEEAEIRAENRHVKLVKLGVDEKLIKAKMGEPLFKGVESGFQVYSYEFKHYNASMLFDDSRKIMRYGIWLKSDDFFFEFDETGPATGQNVKLGVDEFALHALDLFRPVLLDPHASDAEPFTYFELMNGQPGTSTSVRLEFVASRNKLPKTTADIEDLDSLSQTVAKLGCVYGPDSNSRWPFSRAETIALKTWRHEMKPNAITVQRQLSDEEQEQLGEEADMGLCPQSELDEPESEPEPNLPPIRIVSPTTPAPK